VVCAVTREGEPLTWKYVISDMDVRNRGLETGSVRSDIGSSLSDRKEPCVFITGDLPNLTRA